MEDDAATSRGGPPFVAHVPVIVLPELPVRGSPQRDVCGAFHERPGPLIMAGGPFLFDPLVDSLDVLVLIKKQQ